MGGDSERPTGAIPRQTPLSKSPLRPWSFTTGSVKAPMDDQRQKDRCLEAIHRLRRSGWPTCPCLEPSLPCVNRCRRLPARVLSGWSTEKERSSGVARSSRTASDYSNSSSGPDCLAESFCQSASGTILPPRDPRPWDASDPNDRALKCLQRGHRFESSFLRLRWSQG